MKTTKALGKGTRNLTTNVTDQLYLAISRLASVSGCKIGEYVRALLEHAEQNNIIAREVPADRVAWEHAIQSGERPPKIRREIFTGSSAPFQVLRVAETTYPLPKRKTKPKA